MDTKLKRVAERKTRKYFDGVGGLVGWNARKTKYIYGVPVYVVYYY